MPVGNRFTNLPLPNPAFEFQDGAPDATYNSGYAVSLGVNFAPSPLLVNADPTVGAFIRGDLPGSLIGAGVFPQFIPSFVPEGRIGALRIGEGPVGFLRGIHNKIVFSLESGIGAMGVGIAPIGYLPPVGIERNVQ